MNGRLTGRQRWSRRDLVRVFGLGALGLGAVQLTGCAERAAGPAGGETGGVANGVTGDVTIWHWETPPHRVQAYETLGERFSDETGIGFEQVAINFPDYQTRILASAQAGDLPDIIFVNPPQMMLLLERDLALPLDDVFEEIHAEVDFFEPYKDYSVDGHQWGIPLFGIVWPLTYRTDLHEEAGFSGPPETWDEVLTRAEAMHATDLAGFYLPVSTNGNYGNQVVWGFLRSNGARIVAGQPGEEEVVFNSPETIETYEFLSELAQYTGVGAENADWGGTELLIRSGMVQTLIYTGGAIGETAKENEELALSYALGLVPRPDLAREPQNTGYVRAAMVTKAAEERGNLDAAREWLRWVVRQPDNHAELLLAHPLLFMPPNQAVSESETWVQNPLNQKFKHVIDVQVECMQYISVQGFEDGAKSPKAAAIEGSFLTAAVLQRIVLEGMPIADAVAWGHGEYEKILREP